MTGTTGPTRAGRNRGTALVGVRRGSGTSIRRLIEDVTDVAPHPLEAILAARDCRIDLLKKLKVHHRFAVALTPALLLPPGHPLGH